MLQTTASCYRAAWVAAEAERAEQRILRIFRGAICHVSATVSVSMLVKTVQKSLSGKRCNGKVLKRRKALLNEESESIAIEDVDLYTGNVKDILIFHHLPHQR